jgi:hypothetical protein
MLTDVATAFAFGDMHKEISRMFQDFEQVLILEQEDDENYSSMIEFTKSTIHSDLRDCSLKAGDDFSVRIMTMRGDAVLRIGYKQYVRFSISYADNMYIVDEPGKRLVIFRDYNKVCCLYGSFFEDAGAMRRGAARLLKTRLSWTNGVIKVKKLAK